MRTPQDTRVPFVPSLSLETSLEDAGEPRFDEKARRPARPGDIIAGRYQVVGQIGRGSMSRIVQARHLVLDKQFAVKLPQTNRIGSRELRSRFYAEARMASSLTHEHIVSVVDFGEDPTLGLFMVMELINGQNLHKRLQDDGGLALKPATDIVVQIAEALRYAHHEGVIHGDIKSDNVLLIKTTNLTRVVKLLDFGLARPDDGDAPNRIEGSLSYLAPERIRRLPASASSDIYALGILLFEVLTGAPPFLGSPNEVLKQHAESEIPRVSQCVDENLDERADLIVAKATAKDPCDRHPDMAAFLFDLRALMSMHGISSRRHRRATSNPVRSAMMRNDRAAAEVFLNSPLPQAACLNGTITTANRAFYDFLGVERTSTGVRLRETRLIQVYPSLPKDIARVLENKESHTEVLPLVSPANKKVHIAVVIHPPPVENCTESGDIHLVIHPLSPPTPLQPAEPQQT